ncbi:MAG: coenzyme F420-0:L-glutamate ligase [Planctomycetota bacterium]|jgi:coenzyme F420-0:L-glutamate ligase/coenzyme F420-1:gamma-L-glutamate ligase
MMKKIEVFGLQTVPQIEQGDNLPEIIVECSNIEIGGLKDKDILVLTSKIVSKAIGRTRKLSEVVPDSKALAISRRTGKDARWLQMISDEGHKIMAILPLKGLFQRHIVNSSEDKKSSSQVVKHEHAVCITMGKDGKIHTCDAGIDGSNHQDDVVSLLPSDPDREAKKIREQIRRLTGRNVAVILADTEMIPFGTMDFAVGSSGIRPVSKMFGKLDLFGKPKFGGIDLVAHELTSASALVFGQNGAGIPVAIIRGYQYQITETENISNTLIPKQSKQARNEAIRAAIRATSYARGLKQRLLLQVASWFV